MLQVLKVVGPSDPYERLFTLLTSLGGWSDLDISNTALFILPGSKEVGIAIDIKQWWRKLKRLGGC